MHIKVTHGLDIPIKGKPTGKVKALIPSGESSPLVHPTQIALDLTPFEDIKFKLLVKAGDTVKRGQPLAEDKESLGRFFVSPAGGVVHEIRRGMKRRLLDIVIEVAREEPIETHPITSVSRPDRQQLLDALLQGGLFTHIRQRPFNFLADPSKTPRSIFVKALESAPFVPPAEMQVAGYEKEFQAGLDALALLTDGKVHLVYHKDTTARAFLEAKGVQHHTAEGPHPVANPSLHIQNIDPIHSPQDVVWTLDAHAVVAIGFFILTGRYFVERVISIAGPGVLEDRAGYYRVREGMPVSNLVSGKLPKGVMRLISGDILNGRKTEPEDFLGFYDYCLCVVPENTSREFLHFFRLGTDKYSFSRAYASGHFNNTDRSYDFTTSQHGELRPFIDSTLYDKVMPLNVSTIHLVKAVMAEDYDLAVELGLLEVDSEDFALPAFVCLSKIEMPEIIKKGLRNYAADILQ